MVNFGKANNRFYYPLFVSCPVLSQKFPCLNGYARCIVQYRTEYMHIVISTYLLLRFFSTLCFGGRNFALLAPFPGIRLLYFGLFDPAMGLEFEVRIGFQPQTPKWETKLIRINTKKCGSNCRHFLNITSGNISMKKYTPS